jgi:hypothetical protein
MMSIFMADDENNQLLVQCAVMLQIQGYSSLCTHSRIVIRAMWV